MQTKRNSTGVRRLIRARLRLSAGVLASIHVKQQGQYGLTKAMHDRLYPPRYTRESRVKCKHLNSYAHPVRPVNNILVLRTSNLGVKDKGSRRFHQYFCEVSREQMGDVPSYCSLTLACVIRESGVTWSFRAGSPKFPAEATLCRRHQRVRLHTTHDRRTNEKRKGRGQGLENKSVPIALSTYCSHEKPESGEALA